MNTLMVAVELVVGLAVLVSNVLVAVATTNHVVWDHLSITYPKFNPLPMSENIAKEGGWYLLSDDCLDTESPFRGRRYMLNGDRNVILIFDNHGHIAGIQSALRSEVKPVKTGKYKEAFIYKEEVDGGYFYVTAYFTEPGKICCYCAVRDTSVIGDSVILLNGVTSRVNVPMTIKNKNMTATKWVKGLCFPNMGLHLWYDQSKDMSCDDLFPFFALYNSEGDLHAFALGHDVMVESEHYESAIPQFLVGRFVDKEYFPQCLITENKILPTMHVYLTKVGPVTHSCTRGGGGDSSYA